MCSLLTTFEVILSRMRRGTRLQVRKLMIDLVLATDMKQHFALLSQFTGVHLSHGSPTKRQSVQPKHDPPDAGQAAMPMDENERILSLQIVIKAADLANLCDPHHTHIKWVYMLEEEVGRMCVLYNIRRPCLAAGLETDALLTSQLFLAHAVLSARRSGA